MRKEANKIQLNILVKPRTRDRLRKLAAQLSTPTERVTQTSLLEKWINQEYVREFDVQK
jgi:hypothetical protein